jgi:hypothetical protein
MQFLAFAGSVMAGLGPAIRAFDRAASEDLDARIKPGHDDVSGIRSLT